MALIVSVRINDRTLYEIDAVRRTNRGGALLDDDAVSSYEITLHSREGALPWREVALGYIEHRFGDGALALAQKMARNAAEHLAGAAE